MASPCAMPQRQRRQALWMMKGRSAAAAPVSIMPADSASAIRPILRWL